MDHFRTPAQQPIEKTKVVKTLGVTGGIGSGKTAACRILEELGARVFYADEAARRLMQEDERLRTEITEAFGPESYDAGGRLNRKHLAAEVFGSEAGVEKINALVHPRVFEAFEAEKRRSEADGATLLVHEAALIYESGADAHLDAVAVVDAPEGVRIERAAARDGVPEKAVRARMGHQLPPAELRRRADFLIENDGALADLRREVERVYRAFLRPSTDA